MSWYNTNSQSEIFTATGRNQDQLVDRMLEFGMIENASIVPFLKEVDRRYFLYDTHPKPYDDASVSLGCGCTISSPSHHAAILNLLLPKLQRGAKVLDIGASSGYLAVVMSLMISGRGGQCLAIEHVSKISQMMIRAANKINEKLIQNGTLRITCASYFDILPTLRNDYYDCIHIGAALDELPFQLLEKLSLTNGMMTVILAADECQSALQHLFLVTRCRDTFKLEAIKSLYSSPMQNLDIQLANSIRIEDGAYTEIVSSIEKLPDEILLIIFKHLALAELIICERVCRRWQHLLIVTHWPRLRSLKLCEMTGRNPYFWWNRQFSSYIPEFRSEMLETLTKRLNTALLLSKIETGCRLKINHATLMDLISAFPNTRILDLQELMLLNVTHILSEDNGSKRSSFNAVTLNVDKCFEEQLGMTSEEGYADFVLFKIFNSMPFLESLSLRYNTSFRGFALFAVPFIESLTKLDFCMCRRIESETMANILRQFKNLKWLGVYSCYRLNGQFLSCVPQSLQFLDISYCNSIDSSDLLNFIQMTNVNLLELRMDHLRILDAAIFERIYMYSENLTRLFIGNYLLSQTEVTTSTSHPVNLNPILVNYLPRFNHLTHLNLYRNDYIDDPVLLGICSKLTLLQILNIGCTVNVIKFHPLTKLTKLKELDISQHSEGVSIALLIDLCQCCHQLTFVNAANCGLDGFDAIHQISEALSHTHNNTSFQFY